MIPMLQYRIENAYGDSRWYYAGLSTDEKNEIICMYGFDDSFRKSDSVKLIDNVIYRKFLMFNADEEVFRFWLPKYRLLNFDIDCLRAWHLQFNHCIIDRLEFIMCCYERNILRADQKNVIFDADDPMIGIWAIFNIEWNRISEHIEMDRKGNWKWKKK